MKVRMMTIQHDVYEDAKDLPDGHKVVGAHYEGGYWKLFLLEEPEPADDLLAEHLAFFGLKKL